MRIHKYNSASLDGIVECTNCGAGVVEVKCPYTWRNCDPYECGEDSKFFCEIKSNELNLKHNHNYYYQVQGQMAIRESSWIHFVIWTHKGIHVEKIPFNQTFWELKMLPYLKNFYLTAMIPEIFTDRVKRDKSLY